MKKVNLLVLVALLSISTVFATETEPTSDEKGKTVTQQVATLLSEPGFEVKKDLTAQVTLMVNKANEVVVIDVDTKEEYVAAFIKSRLNYEKLDTQKVGEQFTVPVRIIPGV